MEDMFCSSKKIEPGIACAFDDVLLVPLNSSILPSETDVSSYITKNIKLSIPFISSAMDTVTESMLAIEIAKHGGIGCIHKNLSIEQQVSEVKKVKRYENWIVSDPLTVSPSTPISEVILLQSRHKYSGWPVVDESSKLVGVITNRDVRFVENRSLPASEVMTGKNLITVREDVTYQEAVKLLHKYRIERLIVVDSDYKCIGLITVKDIENFGRYPMSSKDKNSRLLVAAAVGTGAKELERAEALIESGVDLIVVDTSHGHSQGVIQAVKNIKSRYDVDLVAGNIATEEAAIALIDAGADAVKVGIGPGSICTTRVVTGVGFPQLAAIMSVVEVCKNNGVRVIADGGIRYSGDVAKAIAAGADVLMIGSLFAGTNESPGEVILYKGRSYKAYRGMGSIAAMKAGSSDRYFQQPNAKLVPQGVEGMVPYKGSLENILYQLTGGLQSAMGYLGCADISEMYKKAKFVRITASGVRESHPHGMFITKESPNYYYDNGIVE